LKKKKEVGKVEVDGRRRRRGSLMEEGKNWGRCASGKP
jgi:hypothetical protein